MATNEDLARVIIKILCRNNCVLTIGDLNKYMKDEGYPITGDANNLLRLIENFPTTFSICPGQNIKGKIVSVYTPVPLCEDHCTKSNQCLGGQNCSGLHICKYFLLSECSRKNCSFGHIIQTDHNNRILSPYLLDRLDNIEIECILKNVKNRTNLTKPDVCSFYNVAKGCSKSTNCPFLHVCKHFLENTCKFEGSCKRSHDITTPGAVSTFRRFGINVDQDLELVLQDLRIMFESSDSPKTRYNSMSSLTGSTEQKPPVKNQSRSARRQRAGRERSISPRNPFTDALSPNQNVADQMPYPQAQDFGGARPKIMGQHPNVRRIPDCHQGQGPNQGNPPYQGQGPNQGNPTYQCQGPNQGNPPYQGQGPNQGNPPYQCQGPNQGNPPYQGQGPNQGYPPHQGQGPNQGNPPYEGQGPNQGNSPYQGQGPNQGYQPYQGQGPNQGNPPYQGQGPNQGNPPYQGQGPNQGNPTYQGQGPNQGNPPYQGQGPNQGNPPYQGQGPNQGNPPYQGQGPNQGNPPYQGQGPNQGYQPHQGQGPNKGYQPHQGQGPNQGNPPYQGQGPNQGNPTYQGQGPNQGNPPYQGQGPNQGYPHHQSQGPPQGYQPYQGQGPNQGYPPHQGQGPNQGYQPYQGQGPNQGYPPYQGQGQNQGYPPHQDQGQTEATIKNFKGQPGQGRQSRNPNSGKERSSAKGPEKNSNVAQPLVEKQISKDKEKPDICLFNLRGACSYKGNCFNVHTNMIYQWQYYLKDWIDFDSETNESIEINYCQPAKENCNAKCRNDDVGMISFTEPMEMTGAKVTKMAVRRLSTVSSVDASPVKFKWTTEWQWYWKNLDGIWLRYGEKDAAGAKSDIDSDTIEAKYLKDPKSSIDFKTTRFRYELDFVSMIQKNLDTENSRRVARRPLFFKTEDLDKRQSTAHDSVEVVPKEWSVQKFKKAINLIDHYEEVQLEETSKEYKQVADLFSKTMPRDKLRRIIRVESGEMWTNFSLKKKQMLTKAASKQVKELSLFHGTDETYIEPICRQGFDFRFSGSRVGAIYGKGSYFARDAKYSSAYATSNERGHEKMFVARVLVGEFEVGKHDFVRPPQKNGYELYDSCVNHKADPSIYVVFTLEQAYPEYLITYENSKQ